MRRKKELFLHTGRTVCVPGISYLILDNITARSAVWFMPDPFLSARPLSLEFRHMEITSIWLFISFDYSFLAIISHLRALRGVSGSSLLSLNRALLIGIWHGLGDRNGGLCSGDVVHRTWVATRQGRTLGSLESTRVTNCTLSPRNSTIQSKGSLPSQGDIPCVVFKKKKKQVKSALFHDFFYYEVYAMQV